jgi:hypothetical protein
MKDAEKYSLKENLIDFPTTLTTVHLSIVEARNLGNTTAKKGLVQEIFLVIVEGPSDKKFFNQIFNKRKTLVIDASIVDVVKETFEGREIDRQRIERKLYGRHMLEILFKKQNYNEFSNNPIVKKLINNTIIGIIDKDFNELPQRNKCRNYCKSSVYKNLFATETEDLETLILEYGGLTIFLNNLLEITNQKEAQTQIRAFIINRSKILGRAFSIAKNNGLSWRDSWRDIWKKEENGIREFAQYINQSVRDSDLTNFIVDLVLTKNIEDNQKRDEIKKLFLSEMNLSELLTFDDMYFCRGHDVIKVLMAVRLNCGIGFKNENQLFGEICEKFNEKKWFKNTELCQSIKNWEEYSKFPISGQKSILIESMYN